MYDEMLHPVDGVRPAYQRLYESLSSTMPDAAVGETNAIPIAHRHVWVATGRDYADVSPLKGIYSGGEATAIEVTVNMTRLA